MARIRPGERIVIGCAGAAFASVWTAATIFIVLLITRSRRDGPLGGTKASLVLHELALFSPFVFVAVVFWVLIAIQFARARQRPAGRASVRRTPTGWVAVFPNWGPALLAAVVFTVALVAIAGVPSALFNRRNPLWFWYIAGPAAVALAALVYRWRDYQPAVTIDEVARTLTLPMGRRVPPVTVAWDAVTDVSAEHVDLYEDDRYDCVVTARGESEPLVVRLYGDGDEGEMVRFAAWLRERIGLPPSEPAGAKG